MTECQHCRNDQHDRCTSGAWDSNKPVVCSCWALHNHYRKARR